MVRPLIAVVDQSETFLRLAGIALSQQGYRTFLTPAGSDVKEQIAQKRPDLVVLDTWLEHRESGWNLLHDLLIDKRTANTPIILCSSDPQPELVSDRVATLAPARSAVVTKPFDPEELVLKARALLNHRSESFSPEKER